MILEGIGSYSTGSVRWGQRPMSVTSPQCDVITHSSITVSSAPSVGRSFTLQYATPIEYCISICWRGVVVLREACLVWEPWPPVPRLLYLLLKAPVCDWSIVDVVVYDRVSRRHGLTSDFVTLRAPVFQPHLSSSSSVFLFFFARLSPHPQQLFAGDCSKCVFPSMSAS